MFLPYLNIFELTFKHGLSVFMSKYDRKKAHEKDNGAYMEKIKNLEYHPYRNQKTTIVEDSGRVKDVSCQKYRAQSPYEPGSYPHQDRNSYSQNDELNETASEVESPPYSDEKKFTESAKTLDHLSREKQILPLISENFTEHSTHSRVPVSILESNVNRKEIVIKDSGRIVRPQKKNLSLIDIKSFTHFISILFALQSCESIIKFITRRNFRDRKSVLCQIHELLFFCDHHEEFLSKNMHHILTDQFFETWYVKLKELVCSLNIEVLFPGKIVDFRIFMSGFIYNMAHESFDGTAYLSDNPFITTSLNGRECDVCNTINVRTFSQYDFSTLRMSFHCTTENMIKRDFFNLKGRKINRLPGKCCAEPILLPSFLYKKAGAKILFITTYWSECCSKQFHPPKNHKIPLKIDIETDEATYNYKLRAGVFNSDDDAIAMIKHGEYWYLIDKKIHIKINPNNYLGKNQNWLLFYEIESSN